jgi:hypothetical protein
LQEVETHVEANMLTRKLDSFKGRVKKARQDLRVKVIFGSQMMQ